ncbi:hypothetical protein JCM13210_02240 [Thermaerobacter litoralis]
MRGLAANFIRNRHQLNNFPLAGSYRNSRHSRNAAGPSDRVAPGMDVLDTVTYRFGCVPNTDPVGASRTEVVDLICQAVAEGAGGGTHGLCSGRSPHRRQPLRPVSKWSP